MKDAKSTTIIRISQVEEIFKEDYAPDMNIKTLFLTLSFLALAFAGCQSNSEPKTYALNEAAPTGDYVHTLTLAEKLETIPSGNTIDHYKNIAADLPAKDGQSWVHLKGLVTNGTAELATLDESNFGLMDELGNLYATSKETSLYVEEKYSPVYIVVQPANSAEWEAYFEIPSTATNLKYYGKELNFVPENKEPVETAYIELGF